MRCPVDGETLVMTERSGVEIDYCPRCRGVWLDRGELDKIIARSLADGEVAATGLPRGAPGGRAAAPTLAEPRGAAPRPGPHPDDLPAGDRPRPRRSDDDDEDDDDRPHRRRRRKSFLDDLFDF